MPRRPDANQRIRDERHEHILRAAADVFARKGLAATKIADIAAAAQVSHGLIYHYFLSKEEIFTQVVTHALQGTEQLAQAMLAHPGTPLERLRWVANQMLEGARRTPAFFLVIQQAQMSETIPAAAHAAALRGAPITRNAIRTLLHEGQAAGEIIAGDVDALAVLFHSCITGLTSLFAVQHDTQVFEIETMLSLFRVRNPQTDG